jgi:repressor LexA
MIDFLAENTYQPSIREIARKFRIRSTKTVSDLLHSLEAKGFIAREESRSRGVRLLGFAAAGATQPIPYYGAIHAGEPALISDHKRGYLTVDRRFLPSENVFCLKAQGNSMAERGILDGDYVLVDGSGLAKDGDVIAARIGTDAAVRTFTHRGANVVLHSANGSDGTIEIQPTDDFAVLGVVCGVFRPFCEKEVARAPQEEPVG